MSGATTMKTMSGERYRNSDIAVGCGRLPLSVFFVASALFLGSDLASAAAVATTSTSSRLSRAGAFAPAFAPAQTRRRSQPLLRTVFPFPAPDFSPSSPIAYASFASFSVMAKRTVPSSSSTRLCSKDETFRSGGGRNAAPAELSDVDRAPLLDPVPEGCKRLFLVRHGEVINPGGDRPVYYGAMDVSLSPRGEQEAVEAASYLSRFDLERVASSPLSRALFGAREVIKGQRQQIRGGKGGGDDDIGDGDLLVLDGFRELDRGDWCGKTKSEIGPDLFARFDTCDPSATPGSGGESYPDLKVRVLQARNTVLDATAVGQASAIVSHLQVTRAILSEALGWGPEKMAGLAIATASVTCIDYDAEVGDEAVRFQSFKPECELGEAKDEAN